MYSENKKLLIRLLELGKLTLAKNSTPLTFLIKYKYNTTFYDSLMATSLANSWFLVYRGVTEPNSISLKVLVLARTSVRYHRFVLFVRIRIE